MNSESAVVSVEEPTFSSGVSRVNVLERDENHTAFTYGRLFVMIWHVDTKLGAVNFVSRHITEFACEQTPRRIGLLTVVEEHVSMPSAEARAGLAVLMQMNAPYLVRSAVAYEGTGFKAAAIRAVSTGIALLSKHSFPHRIFSGVGAATAWLGEGMTTALGTRHPGAQLARAVDDVRVARRGIASRAV
jgi:hypothetical protein